MRRTRCVVTAAAVMLAVTAVPAAAITDPTNTSTTVSTAPAAADPGGDGVNERISKLEQEVADLRARVEKLEGDAGPVVTPTVTATPTATETSSPTEPPSTTTSTTATSTATTPPASPAGDVVTLPAKGLPPDPGDKKVRSPNPSPLIDVGKLTGPKIRVKAGDNPEALLNGKTLTAGTVVEFERGAVWANTRLVIKAAGTAAQPVLLTAVGTGTAPTFKATKAGRSKDDGVVNLEGTHVHVDGLKVTESASVGFGANAVPTVLNDVEGDRVVIGTWIRGNGSKVWNSYFHNLRMMPDTPGPNDDYGASGIVVEAHDVVSEGVTCRECRASSPDYDQYGGDGSFAEVWMKGDRLRISHSYLDKGPRVLEAGGLGQGNSAVNMQVNGVYAHVIQDAPFYFNPNGDYSGLNTSGFRQFDNVITRK